MIKKSTRKTISAILIFFFVFSIGLIAPSTNSVLANPSSPYKDVSTSHWGIKHIVKMNVRGVVAGYPDGTFQPDIGVTQLEALLMAIKNMGADAEIARIDPNQNLAIKVPEWAEKNLKKELLFALEKNLIIASENNFVAESNASRAWMTQLMVRMIGKDSEAKTMANQISSFSDASSIPGWANAYINAAMHYNLISGYPDNTFKPSNSITRAQAVTLLSRSEKYLGLDDTVRQGPIKYLSGSQITILNNNEEKTYGLSSATWFFDQNDRPLSGSGLKVDNNINYIVDKNNNIKYIDISTASSIKPEPESKPDYASKIDGKVLTTLPNERVIVVQDKEDKIHTLTLAVNGNCYDQNGNIFDFENISAGFQVELRINEDGRINTIIIAGEASQSNTGVIHTIESDSQLIILKSKLGTFSTYRYDERTQVLIGEQRFPRVLDLRVGDEVKIKDEGNYASEIELLKAQQEMSISGQIVLISTEKNLLVVQSNNVNYTFELTNDAKITIPGLSHPLLADLTTSDQVNIQITNGKAASITVSNRSVQNTLNGKVVAIDSPKAILIIRTDNDELKSYEIAHIAEIIINDRKNSSITDIRVDMKVHFELLNNKIIFLENRNTYEGHIASLNIDRRLLTLRNKNAEAQTYIISPNIDVYIEDISRAKLEDLKLNDYIEIKVTNDLITRINAERTIVYEILEVYASTKRLHVKSSERSSKNLYLDRSYEMMAIGAVYPDISKFNNGDSIEVTYLGDKIHKIILIPSVYGEISAINTYTGAISVKAYDGKHHTFYFTSNSEVVDGSKKSTTLNSLAIGDRIRIIESIGNKTSFYLMTKISGRFRSLSDSNDYIYITRDSRQVYYYLASQVKLHSEKEILTFRNLKMHDILDLYTLDNLVYEIYKR